MSTFTVDRVRKEWSADMTHRHIAGVLTTTYGSYHTRAQVVASIAAGDSWYSTGGGYTAKIHTLRFCPRSACLATPYIATNPDSSLLNNLENLPEG